MNFGSDIECGKGCFVGFKVCGKKPSFVFGEDSVPLLEPSLEELSDVDGVLLSLAVRELSVGV